jgi:uncharacterized protein (DUF488 family)
MLCDEEFGMRYYEETLSTLDPQTVYDELGEDAILLCFEKPPTFCHRHLVAKWLEFHLGKPVRELGEPNRGNPLDSYI